MGFDATEAAKLMVRAQKLAKEMNDVLEELKDFTQKNTSTLNDACESYVLVKNVASVLHGATKEINKYETYVSYSVIPDLFVREGVKTITTESGYRVTISQRLSVSMQDSVISRDWLIDNGMEALADQYEGEESFSSKLVAYEWLRIKGYGSIIQTTVNASALSSTVKQMIETENIEPPFELFETKPTVFTSITQVKSK